MPISPKTKARCFLALLVGGGSSMGYKLAGFDVIGCNEIDPRMMYTYCQNNNPRFPFLEPIQTFKERQDLPPELFKSLPMRERGLKLYIFCLIDICKSRSPCGSVG